jgi:hypothetical protein
MALGHEPDPVRRRERLLHHYVQAFDAGDLEAIAAVLAAAETDPELDARIRSVNEALHAEAGLQPLDEQAVTVRRLLYQYLPSGTADRDDEVDLPLTVGEVAARIKADEGTAQRLAAADRFANQQLLASELTVPETVTAPAIADLAARLQAAASPRYWETFRRTAVMLQMARGRERVGLMAARRRAARRAFGHKSRPKPGTGGQGEAQGC